MRVMWIIAIHRKTYPHCRLRAICAYYLYSLRWFAFS